MSMWSRLANVFRRERLSREIIEELDSHLAEAIENGRDPDEARRALGSAVRYCEHSRDIKLIPWLGSLRSDVVVSWRQLNKKKTASAAAILSLGLAIGACTTAFRLIDALLLRPLPVAHPEQLYTAIRKTSLFQNSYQYPALRGMREAVRNEAELIGIAYPQRMDLTYGSDRETEKAFVQYVSGSTFPGLGLRPAIGRLLGESDDVKPGGHPYVVLSYDYWTRRFQRDQNIVGRTIKIRNDPMWMAPDLPNVFEVVGVAEDGFTGVGPGTVIDIFLPTTMHGAIRHPEWYWLQIWVRLHRGASPHVVETKLDAAYRAYNEEQVKLLPGQSHQRIQQLLAETVTLEHSSAGFSGFQDEYGSSLAALGALVFLVLLITCANIANLITTQSAARVREMALRVSIGAGRWRLMQLVMVESAWVGVLAAGVGAVLAGWSAPFVVRMISSPTHPIRLILPGDWRVLGFGVAVTIGATILFGMAPALRASAVRPIIALKGSDDPRSRRRTMDALVAVQVAFCFLVLFASGLFVTTFERLSNQPLGFSADRILTLDTVSEKRQPAAVWNELVERIRQSPGVAKVAFAYTPLLSGTSWTTSISINGSAPSQEPAHYLGVSPGWMSIMKIPFVEGRDFDSGETSSAVAIVNEAFARRYFQRANPIGQSFDTISPRGRRQHFNVIGLVRNARYGDIRGPFPAIAYVPFDPSDNATLVVKTTGANPLALVSILQKAVTGAHPGFRVSNIRTQEELIDQYTIRERMLAALAVFFAMVALLLAGVGLYGVLDYSLLQRRREIGIRIAIGAPAGDIVRRVALESFLMVFLGALLGWALGEASVRYLENLLFAVKATDAAMLVIPSLAIVTTAVIASLPSLLRAVRVDLLTTLRND